MVPSSNVTTTDVAVRSTFCTVRTHGTWSPGIRSAAGLGVSGGIEHPHDFVPDQPAGPLRVVPGLRRHVDGDVVRDVRGEHGGGLRRAVRPPGGARPELDDLFACLPEHVAARADAAP